MKLSTTNYYKIQQFKSVQKQTMRMSLHILSFYYFVILIFSNYL